MEHAAKYNQELCMKGAIRTKERCPKCAGKFSSEPLVCPSCLTHPQKYYVDLHCDGERYRIFANRQGNPLRSWDAALRVRESIRYEIDNNHSFDPSKYVASEIRNFIFRRLIVWSWYRGKLIEVKKGNLASSYVRTLKCFIRHYYLPTFGEMDVRAIRTFHVKQFYERLPKKSLKYIKNIMAALDNFFNMLQSIERIDKKPVFPDIKLDQKAPKWVDFHTQIKIVKALPLEHRPIFLFLAWQGLRPGEARALKVKDVDLKNETIEPKRTYSDGVIKERVKNKSVRIRAINPALMGLLKRHCRDKHPEAYVFINPGTGRPYSETVMKVIWESVAAKGFDIKIYEATRHSFATGLLKNGAHLKGIGDLLGHSDIRTTLKYAHSDIENQRIAFRPRGAVLSIRHQTVTGTKKIKT